MGMLTRKMLRHPSPVRSKPPTTGPAAIATPLPRSEFRLPGQFGHGGSKISTDPGEGYVDNCYVERINREGKATGRYNPRNRGNWQMWRCKTCRLRRGEI